MSSQPTACVLIIGNEILSGKTQDTNLQFLGFELAKLGIRLAEGRVVRDEPAAIIRHLNETRREFTYVFTTGGIGPTHDDITAECVAQAFGVPLELNDDAVERLKRSGRPLNEARLKMARLPRGAELVDNPDQQCARLPHRERVRVRGHPEHCARDVRERDPDARAGRADPVGERRRVLARRRLRRRADEHPAATTRRSRSAAIRSTATAGSARRSWRAARIARCSAKSSAEIVAAIGALGGETHSP